MKRILFVCTANQDRSATAHLLYSSDPRFEVKSAGTASYAKTPLTHELLAWADVVLVMEYTHERFISSHYPDMYEKKKVVCLDIADKYILMQPELAATIRERVESLLAQNLI